MAKPSHIQSIRSLKIGILGLLTSDTADYPAAREGIAILGETETARNTIKELRKEADIVIVLSHCGERFDRQLARAIPDIDIIIGGHSHSRILKDTIVFHPNKTKAEYINGTIVVQAYQWGGELGRLDLSFSRDTGGVWRIDRYKESFLPITADTPEDPTVAAVVKKYWDPIAPYYGEIIGSAGADFVERGDDLAPYNLFADAIRESLGTEIELENMGGIRAPLIRGDITRGALIDMDPFDNTIVTFTISGSRLRKILQSHRPAVSGIRYRMKKGKLVDVTVGGKPLRDDGTYTGSTNSYFARRALRGVRVRDTGRQRLDLLIEYIRKAQTVYPVYDGRRVIVN